jgi:transcriptional regulator with XRE-family HTH domain
MTESAWGKKLWDYRKNLGVSRKKFAELLGINEGTLRSYETEQRKPGYETYKKIEEYINKRDKVKEGELNMNQQNRLIEYQEKEIIQLRKENKRLSNINNNYLDNEIGTDYQFSMDVKFKFRPSQFAVDIMYVKALTSFDYIVDKLGYTKEELSNDIFSFGKYINYNDHTIHQLRSEDQKARMLQKASNIIRSMLFSKDEMAAYNLKLPITYLSKDGDKVHAINQFLVDWEAKTAVANIHFMNGSC